MDKPTISKLCAWWCMYMNLSACVSVCSNGTSVMFYIKTYGTYLRICSTELCLEIQSQLNNIHHDFKKMNSYVLISSFKVKMAKYTTLEINYTTCSMLFESLGKT